MKELSELNQLEKADPENTKCDTLHPLAATAFVTKSRSREVQQWKTSDLLIAIQIKFQLQ